MSEQPLGDRRERILRAIVEAYVSGAEPVGSRTVAEESGLGVSAATVRNEMGILEREGYIVQPHTSAGRIPTDKAYRYYVDVLAPKGRMDPKQAQEIERSLSGTLTALDDLLQQASEILAELTDYAALASAPPMRKGRLHWLDLVPLGGRRVFLIVVGEGARHEEWLLELPTEIAEDAVKRAAERINRMVGGLTPDEAADKLAQHADADVAEVAATVAKALRSGSPRATRLFRGGTSHTLSWGSPPIVRRILEAIEEGELSTLLPETERDGIAVRIGTELPITDLQSLSLIVAGYEMGRQAGSLGVLGPTRMDYPSVIATVATVAQSVSRALRRLDQS